MESHDKALRVAVWIAAVAAAAVFVRVGAAKLGGEWIGRFEQWGYRPNFSIFIGCLELAGALTLVIPATSAWAALGLILIMFGALETHLVEANWFAAAAPASMIGLLGFVLFGRGLSGRGRL